MCARPLTTRIEVDETNDSITTAIASIEKRFRDRQAEQKAALAIAIAGDGDAPSVVRERLSLLEQECSLLSRQIEEARRRVQSQLIPRADLDAVCFGDAPLLADEGSIPSMDERAKIRLANRVLLKRLLHELLVYPDGSLYARFKLDGLFAPVRGVRLDVAGAKTLEPLSRGRHEMRQQRLHAELSRADAPEHAPVEQGIQFEIAGARVDMDAVGPRDRPFGRARSATTGSQTNSGMKRIQGHVGVPRGILK